MKPRILLAVLPLVFGSAAVLTQSSDSAGVPSASGESAYIGTTTVETKGMPSKSDGDLWPSCWAGNNNLYTANGDGKGFSVDGPFSDVAVSEVQGDVGNLTGQTVALGDQIGSIWSGPTYNRKPTGMVCVGDTIYLAVQDLALDFNDVPAATIAKSTDHGRTWTWDKRKPMFADHVFTTIWFADYGRGGAQSPDKYVYAYGLDGNWRDSFDDTVADPQDVYLARVPKTKIQDRKAWQFYAGDTDGRTRWSAKVADRKPVITDQRHLYGQTYNPNNISNLTVISQGGVTYLPQQKRYIYTSWTEYTFEFYESPTPWGPWKHFLSKDFSGYPWTTSKYGGYGVTIPSKFVQPDGKSMYLQANVCPCGGGGIGFSVYNFNLRKLVITPGISTPAVNPPSEATNLATSPDTVAISKSSRSGNLTVLNDASTAGSENDFDDEVKSASWWGYTWPNRKLLNRVDFTSGDLAADGGWFTGRPKVQVRHGYQWVDAIAQTISPAYPGDATAGAHQTYTLTFSPVEADGVRVIGFPGGSKTYTSISELAVRYVTQVADGGFEAPGVGQLAWGYEGNANHGVDRALGFAHSGSNNGWIRCTCTGFSTYTQTVPVSPGKTYKFASWIRSSDSLPANAGRFGIRQGTAGSTVLAEQRFSASAPYAQQEVTVTIPAGVTAVTVYAGFDAPGVDTFIQLDDFTITES